jgi:hypothetical protein
MLKKCKKCDFYLRRGDFIMFFKDKPAIWPIAKKTGLVIKDI